MAKGILVSYAGYPYTLSSLFPDNGLASLAAVLRAEGHECLVLDFNTSEVISRMVDDAARRELVALLPRIQTAPDDDVLRRLQRVAGQVEARGEQVARDIADLIVGRCRLGQVDFVGFKLWNGDGYEASLKIAARVRAECPGVKLFAGGPSVHYCAQVIAQEAPVFDAVIDGDGEEAIIELAKFSEGRRSVEGVPNLVRACGEQSAATAVHDLSTLPIPDYSRDVYPAVWSGEKIKLFCIDESRGCPMCCAFCINWRIAGTTWRTRNVKQVIQQIIGFRDQLGSRAFRFAGTYSPPKLLREICDAIAVAGLDVSFGVSLHAAGATTEVLQALRRAGCFGIFIGVESGSDHILTAAMEKSVSAKTVMRALAESLQAGLFTTGSFVFPAPFETAESEAATKALIVEAFQGQPLASVSVCFPGLLPRTRWWQDRAAFGFHLEVDEAAYLRTVLRYKIRHLIPATFWPALPYRLDGSPQQLLAQRAVELQIWVSSRGIAINLPDHDAQIGASLHYSAHDFQKMLRASFFTGDAETMHKVVGSANEALA